MPKALRNIPTDELLAEVNRRHTEFSPNAILTPCQRDYMARWDALRALVLYKKQNTFAPKELMFWTTLNTAIEHIDSRPPGEAPTFQQAFALATTRYERDFKRGE